MAIKDAGWMISSDVAHEVAFRIDVPEPERGRWVLSYLPTARRITREQALAGIALAEMIVLEFERLGAGFDDEVAALHAELLGLTLTEVVCLLVLRGLVVEGEESSVTWRGGHGRREVSR
ncbi:hypothetical protein ACIP5Y_17590 [Nocardia sp. NPDC088792]|uniref:hypothetical protein n=1 Tax=Nocardia sp. NPDC088792 TaxID=3364332 RepID=UPI0038174755